MNKDQMKIRQRSEVGKKFNLSCKLSGSPMIATGRSLVPVGGWEEVWCQPVVGQKRHSMARKKFYFPNDLLMKVLKKLDRAYSPPLGFLTVYELCLRAKL
ncbi:hypothetical protein IEQ34_020996 [Dendrobium chrysotoxum]|uniref:Uncharacterized protein n=1 Tax=Dendrobium chrysotoxum TaxID=161865 RepID=A0AAV7G3T8_DENCH|nr:hypothetical protein IEQ34_020996 [Dendrobium chrysotoxum]